MTKKLFLDVFGNSPQVKIIDFLITNKELDYSLSEISRKSNVAWSTLNTIWPNLEKNKIVIHTRNVGKAKMYKLNTQNKFIEEIIKLAEKDY